MRLTRRPAAFTPDTGRPICPTCWSGLDLNWGKGRGAGEREMRGWGVSRARQASDAGDETLTTVIHRCANTACPTAITVTTRLAGGYAPTVVDEHRLHGDDAAHYTAGRTGPDRIWRDRAGEPRTTPVQRDLFGV